MTGQGMMLYRNDKLFQVTQNKTANSCVIVITGQGEIRIGHDNYVGRNYRNVYSYDPPWEYVYYDVINQKLLEDILLENDSIKGLTRHFQNIPSHILTYLANANVQEIKNVLAYYKEITNPKKYILIHGGCNNYEDEMRITFLEDFNEAERIIEDEFKNENYFGFFKMNLRNSGYWFSLIVTDDEKLNGKYRDALSYDEFIEVCKRDFDEQTIIEFQQVWQLKIKSAEKFWKNDRHKEDGQTFYSGRYSQWRKGNFNL